MADTLTPQERSKRMSRIKSKDTQLEMDVRRALYARGLRYTVHDASLPGKPDMVFKGRRLAVFINGCFWHGHRCPIGHVPKSNSSFWKSKIATNRTRDARNIHRLRAMDWTVVSVWECSMQTQARARESIDKLEARIRKVAPRRKRA
ncbi:MAG TPA: very short patch repair endonuclease [Noviherbaspirillum sp.]|uniref:very short patch repair endonuclease n=1 Tax=Noviherbaspirillum sp. TaxID=1926288 RepID=UPI002B47FC25|nr:very short patch repair endonuclease [Noviherbaspirillum sp.]HJV86596.1 very short patch repair endonuclease [Noviherbaspirillum sp.]